MRFVPVVFLAHPGSSALCSSTSHCLDDDEAEREQPDQSESDPEINGRGMTGQGQVAPHGTVDLLPPKNSHAGGEDREQPQDDAEYVAGAGDRQLRDQLDDGHRRGEQAERGALPCQERSFIREREAVVRFDLRHVVGVAHQSNLSKRGSADRPYSPA